MSRVPHAIGIGLTICQVSPLARVLRSESTEIDGTRSPTWLRVWPGRDCTLRVTST